MRAYNLRHRPKHTTKVRYHRILGCGVVAKFRECKAKSYNLYSGKKNKKIIRYMQKMVSRWISK